MAFGLGLVWGWFGVKFGFGVGMYPDLGLGFGLDRGLR